MVMFTLVNLKTASAMAMVKKYMQMGLLKMDIGRIINLSARYITMSLKSLFQMGANTQVHILSFQTIKSRTGRVSLNI